MNTTDIIKLLDDSLLSTKDTAELFGVNTTTVNRWRTGEHVASNAVVLVLRSLVTGKCVAELL